MVVKAPLAYSIIFKKPTLNQARVVMSTYSLVVKFPTPQGLRILRGDQVMARSCYVSSMRKDAISEALNFKGMNPREEKNRASPVEELTQITLDPCTPDRVVSIGSLLESDLRAELAQFLRQNQDIFT